MALLGEEPTPVPAVVKAVRVMSCMARAQRVLTLSEICRETGLAKSSVSDLLTSLASTDMVRRTPRGWLLGYRVLELSQAVMASTDTITEFRKVVAASPALRQETVLFGVLDGTDVLYVARHNGNQPVRLATDIGSRLPAVVTAMGKAMLAAMPPAALDERLSHVGELPVFTRHSHRTREDLLADLARVRDRGYAIDAEQNTLGVTCFGFDVPGFRQPSAVSTTLISSRVTPQLAERLTSELSRLSRHLSHAGQAA